MATVGTAVLVVCLKWSTSESPPLWSYLLCSLPASGALMGLLLTGKSGGALGACAGATLACLIRLLVGFE
jgi:hypothetical protein